MKVGFIGLGKMGTGMVRSLLRAGHQVWVYNRTRDKAEALAKEGAQVAPSIAELCRASEAVFTMLSDDSAVENVVFSEGGLAASLAHGAVHISSSTISTAMARRLMAEHARRQQGFISATVFGRPDAAEAGKLLVVAGGPPDLVERLRPLFEAVGRQTLLAGGESWHANAVKLCGNFMIACVLEAIGEAMATLRKADVGPHRFLDVMNAFFGSPIYENYGRIISDERFEPAGFELRLGLKDIRLVLETAQECEAPMPMASLIRDHFLSAMALGQENLDWSSIAKVAARNAGL
ncbi:MAG TPA: NAD(P)-dependent oxidoreductase [Bryobacteraceae bacterium]|nr:NAD(P)-dependent oxidoreductase [Bryobacteraceae bacterium]